MKTIPELWDRINIGKWAVPAAQCPAVVAAMLSTPTLAYDPYDLSFHGQVQRTTYFDDAAFDLRRAKQQGDRYLTLRVRCYEGTDGEAYALNVKTENGKWRKDLSPIVAEQLIVGEADVFEQLPSDLQARAMDLADYNALAPVVCVSYRRYAVQDEQTRLTLDCQVEADSGKRLHYGVLELKSVDPDAGSPSALQALWLRPIKLSKFLWATGV